jgi:hypothetical protein
MPKTKKTIVVLLSIIFLIFFSFQFKKVRDISIDQIPTPEILDEFDFVWIGKSFFETGIPTGWSDFSIYKTHPQSSNQGKIYNFSMTKNHGELITIKNRDQKDSVFTSIEDIDYGIGERQLNFVSPYFDHPLLAGVVYAFLVPGEKLEDIKPQNFRKMPILLSVLTGLLVFIFCTQIWGVGAGLLSFFVYSTVPSFFFFTRLALAENLIAPLALLSLIFLQLFHKKPKNLFLLFSGLFAGLTSLTKLPGVFMILLGTYYLYSSKKRSQIKFFLLPALLIFSLYPLHGFLLSPDLFLKVLFSQSSRAFSGSLNLVEQIIHPTFRSWFLDPWWTGSWLISFLQLPQIFKKQKTKLLSLAFVLLLLTTTFMSSAQFPWYYLAAIPFLSIFVGKFIQDTILYFSKTNLFLLLIFFISGSFHWGYYVLHQSSLTTVTVFRFLILFVTLVILFEKNIKSNPFSLFLTRLFLILLAHRLFLWNFRSITYILSIWPLPLNS